MTQALFLTFALLLGYAAPQGGSLPPVRVDGVGAESVISPRQLRVVVAEAPNQVPRTLNAGATRTAEAYWLALRLQNGSDRDVERYLQVPDPLYGDVRVWVGDRHGFSQAWLTGNDLPMSTRPVRHPTFVFPLHFKAHEEKFVLAYVLTESAPLATQRVLTAEALLSEDSSHGLVRGLCLGALLIAALFSAGVGVATRTRAYGWLTVHLLANAYFMFSYLGLAAVYWWPNQPWLTEHTTASGAFLGVSALVRFVPEFINLAPTMSGARAMRGAAMFTMCAAVAMLFYDAPWLVQGVVYTSAAVVSGVLLLSLQRAFSGDVDAQNFVLAMSASLVTLIVAFALEASGAATRPELQSIPLVAMAVSSTAIAIAIVQRLRRAMREHAEAMDARVESTRLAEQLSARAEAATFESERRSAFLATMSHEIRTPMNGILGTAAMLADSPLSNEAREWVRTLTRAGDHLLRLLNDILDLSRIERTDLQLEQRAFDLLDLIDDVQQLQLDALRARKVALYVQIAPGVPRQLVCDPSRLQQIIVNLVANAVKFTTAGFIELRVRFDAHEERLHFEIEDTGCGIAADVGDSIFERFRQADESITRKFGGTGLGLAICKLLVTKLGGAISYRSEADVGSTFAFDVRAAVVAADPHAQAQAPCRVGLLSDDARLLRMCCSVLEHLGHQPIVLDPAGALLAPCDVVLAASAWRGQAAGNDSSIAGAASSAPIVAMLPAPGQPLSGTVGVRSIRKAMERAPNANYSATQDLQPVRDLSGWRLLVVDDNEVNTQVVASMLRRMGAEVEVASSGARAVDVVCADGAHFDAVLMDCEMPELDGYATTRRIRSRGNNVPILALTAHVLPQYEARARDAGMQGFIAKPVRRPQLHDALVAVVASVAVSRQTSHIETTGSDVGADLRPRSR